MREIPLSRGLTTQVDDEDFERFGLIKWWAKPARKQVYAVRSVTEGNRKRVYHLHRQIMGLLHGDDREVDHIDGDGLNNCKSNLRICTSAQNGRNRSVGNKKVGRFRWVYPVRNSGKWIVRTSTGSVKSYLGLYDTDIEAASAANKFFEADEFAQLNQIPADEYLRVLKEKESRLIEELYEIKTEVLKVETWGYKWLK